MTEELHQNNCELGKGTGKGNNELINAEAKEWAHEHSLHYPV